MSDHSEYPSSSASVATPPAPAPSAAPQAMTGHVTLGNGQVLALASPGKRLGARIIDAIVIFIAVVVVGALGFGGGLAVGSAGGDSDAAAFAAVGAFFMTLMTIAVLTIAYEVTLTAIKGQTLGKMALGIRVARADNGGVPGWGKAIIRWALPALLGFIPLVGMLATLLVYLSLLWDDRRQGWHDKAAATVVVA